VPFSLATYNVKSLVPPRSDADRARLPAKLDALATALRRLNADVVALQEIGPPELAQELVDRLSDLGYSDPVLGTADGRGIRCALLARPPLLEVTVHTADALSFPVFRAGDPGPFGTRIPLRRGIVHATVDAGDLGAVHVLVAHFKSRLPVPLRDAAGAEVPDESALGRAEGLVRSLVWRAAEALQLRRLVDAIVQAQPAAHVAIAGDFNDTSESPVLNALRSAGPGALFDCTTVIPEAERFSILHLGRGTQIDHVLVTAGLRAHLRSAEFANADLRDHGPSVPGVEEELTIDSDHAPLVVRFA
jgi:endonuclease/exonuclease/phosphatase family metal-dependent hydrolase